MEINFKRKAWDINNPGYKHFHQIELTMSGGGEIIKSDRMFILEHLMRQFINLRIINTNFLLTQIF